MSNIKVIRERLGLTQSALAAGIGCTQGNVGHYERGQTIPPDAAKRLIDYAMSRGCVITFNDIYMPDPAPSLAPIASQATENVAVTAEVIAVDPTGALRSDTVRRHATRRAKDVPIDVDRRHSGPPFQSTEVGVA